MDQCLLYSIEKTLVHYPAYKCLNLWQIVNGMAAILLAITACNVKKKQKGLQGEPFLDFQKSTNPAAVKHNWF